MSGAKTILVVEDEDLVREYIVSALQLEGYNVLAAADSLEALRICEGSQRPIHLLVTDVVMPRMSGGDLAEQARRTRQDLSVLYVSGYAPNAIERQGVLAPNAHFLEKPFGIDELVDAVREILDEGQ